jgi:hypothetical protein
MAMFKPDYMLEHPKASTPYNGTVCLILGGEMDNQQEIRFAAARIAMMIDTDGWATINVTQRSKVRNANLVPAIGMVNTSRPLIEWLDKTLTELGIPHYLKWYDLSGYKGSRCKMPQGRITVQGVKRLQKFLPLITPFLIAKSIQGKLLQEYVDLASARPGKAPYSQRELEIANYIRGFNSNKGGNWRPVSSETVRQAREMVDHLNSLKRQSDLSGDTQSEAEMTSPQTIH